MPAPLVLGPLAVNVLRLGAVAAVAVIVARRARPRSFDLGREAILDDVEDGLDASVSRDDGAIRADASAGIRRVIRIGRHGPGLAVDGALMGRFRVRRAPGVKRPG